MPRPGGWLTACIYGTRDERVESDLPWCERGTDARVAFDMECAREGVSDGRAPGDAGSLPGRPPLPSGAGRGVGIPKFQLLRDGLAARRAGRAGFRTVRRRRLG